MKHRKSFLRSSLHWLGAVFFYFAASIQIASLPQAGGWPEIFKALCATLLIVMGTRQALKAYHNWGDI